MSQMAVEVPRRYQTAYNAEQILESKQNAREIVEDTLNIARFAAARATATGHFRAIYYC